ncbi:WD40 repeat-like protein [Dacryopinax primogenitus]|uniref:methylated diphthine methylhydrolase n=1 Tax=Dacryopinax primogenitus (strain DJM 731) TaxID=1858805 RepID=M5FWN4_DACPD|nr:WD40 repeat-like protein [Dacryopinax primogenitus]EJU02361.1 WD40 repeat-like protein [Dacryopinax primogenitus]
MYRLIEGTPQRRVGGVVLWEVTEDGLNELSTCESAGVLDLHWARRADGTPLLLTANAEGNLNLYTYGLARSSLSSHSSISCSSTALALSLSLPPSPSTPALGETLVSLSSGELAHLIPREEGLELVGVWKAHEHEAWVVAWGAAEQGVLYSGSDDLTLKGWDLRAGTESPTFVTRRFDAGVVSIVPSPWTPHQIAVGTYDSLVRIYDTRAPLRPLESYNVAGGAWRLQFHPSAARKSDLLVAAMHGGAEIVRLSPGAGEDSQERTKFEGHESMCYAARWVTTEGAREDVVASCSFYDHRVCLWRG